MTANRLWKLYIFFLDKYPLIYLSKEVLVKLFIIYLTKSNQITMVVICLEAIVGFHFVDDSLIEAGYAFREASLDRDLYIWEYERVKLVLTQMYGEPLIDKDISNQCEKEVSAVESFSQENSYMFIAEWLNSRSIIRLILVSDQSSLEFGVLHLRREHDSAYKIPMNCAANLEK